MGVADAAAVGGVKNAGVAAPEAQTFLGALPSDDCLSHKGLVRTRRSQGKLSACYSAAGH